MSTEERENILLVDDNPANLKLLTEILKSRGYHPRAVTSGPRAIASVNVIPPDLILLDIRMPEMNGYDVCRQIKENPSTRDIPIIFISALDEIEEKVRAFSIGCVDYITKPFHMEEVIARVENHLALRRLQRNLEGANNRMHRELELAAQVQFSFLPKNVPDLPGWQISTALHPAKTTSGDFFDVIRLPGNRYALLIADVVDKGVWAALFMAMCCTLLRTSASEYPIQPECIFGEVNRRILEYTTGDQFITVFLGILNPETGELVYSNAGHNPPILVSSLMNQVQLLRSTGLPLGIEEETIWEQRSIFLHSQDVLVMYTDGITEAENEKKEFYSLDRLIETSCRSVYTAADTLKNSILEDVRSFTDGAALSDDIALMIVIKS